jgi:hypothetical protein
MFFRSKSLVSAVLSFAVLTACAGDAISPNALNDATTPGEVSASLSGSSISAAGGASGAEYALVAFNGSTSGTTRTSLTVTPTGTTALTSSLSASTSGFALLDRGIDASLGVAASTEPVRSFAFDARLRAIEAAELTPRLPAARQWQNGRANPAVKLSVLAAQLNVGEQVSLNVNANSACSSPVYQTGRIAAVGSKAVVVADVSNPAGGFTDAEYASIVATFDTLIAPVDTKAFGDVTDIDGNGKVVLFFTKAVNALTERNSKSYISGFFFARDLFPTRTTGGIDGCAGSNVGEMFYLMVPDPSGTVNGNIWSKSAISTIALGTIAHEFEHLINSSRRVYVNTGATDFEESWLDEGLAHIAEELLFYAESGLTPGKNLDATTIRSSTVYKNAFNTDALANFGRLELLLESPSLNSPFADNDSLQTRGATWSFLRYAADRQSLNATAWNQLVNSTTTGMANLRNVFGSDVSSLMRDWSTSLIADDVSGVASKYQQPSWHFRSLFDALSNGGGLPLKTTTLSSGTSASATLVPGGSVFFRFAVAAGNTATVSWGTLPTNVQMTLVRIK